METAEGPIRIARGDGKLAVFSSPGQPDRPVALKRRELPELLAEELRWSDEDDIYAAVDQAAAQDAGPRVSTRIEVLDDADALARAVAGELLPRLDARRPTGGCRRSR